MSERHFIHTHTHKKEMHKHNRIKALNELQNLILFVWLVGWLDDGTAAAVEASEGTE